LRRAVCTRFHFGPGGPGNTRRRNPTARAGPNVSDRKEPTLLGGAGCRIDRATTIASRAELATAARSETSRATTRGATVRSRADRDKLAAAATADSPRWIVRSNA